MPLCLVSRVISFGLAIATCASIGVAMGQERWETYTNPRFGTAADFPSSIFSVRNQPPDNGDGQSFQSSDGRAQLSIYGQHNAGADTPKSYLENYVDQQGVSYRRVTSRYYVVSGVRDGSIFYQRCNFSADRDGIIDCLNVSYPIQEKAAWDSIVARLSQSLRPGHGIEPRP